MNPPQNALTEGPPKPFGVLLRNPARRIQPKQRKIRVRPMRPIPAKRRQFATGILLIALATGLYVFLPNHPPQQRPLALIALSHQGDTRYEAAKWNGWYRPGSNKCNQAVADWIAASGHPRPHVPGHLGIIPRDPSAHEWADPQIVIAGWSQPMPVTLAQPGDVIAQQHGPIYGHVGIVVAPGQTASAYGEVNPQGLVLINDWGFRTTPNANGESATDPAPVVRRFQPANIK